MRNFYAVCFLLLLSLALAAQETLPNRDLCVPFGDGIVANVTPSFIDQPFVAEGPEGNCIRVTSTGDIIFQRFAREETCCGFTDSFDVTFYSLDGDTGGIGEPLAVQPVTLTIKCPKPSCNLVELNLSPRIQNPNGEDMTEIDCLTACENSETTYYYGVGVGLQYEWAATGGNPVYAVDTPDQVVVEWGPAASGTLTVTIRDGNGNQVSTKTWCVDLNPTPVADFTAPTEVCLNQTFSLVNTTTGPAATYSWDFGDGSTQQNVTNPTHFYTTPGPKTVTLYATSDNINPDGTQGCCCTDSTSYVINVSKEPGPGIFWISTLCEGDDSKYWTDATGCDTLNWSVSGNGVITSGAGTDTIMVSWGAGPSGEITLEAIGCDNAYCPVPTVAVVPIISSDGPIAGPDAICPGVTTSYQLPKWMTTAYEWSLSGGGVINGAPTGNTASITWGSTPGTYTITANYRSDFLQGLPGHEGSDCIGSATFEVTVLGDFTVTAGPNPACVDGATNFFAVSNINPSAGFTYDVTGFPGLGGSGNPVNITWPSAGTYTVQVSVDDPAAYCDPVQQVIVHVEEPAIPSISGPTEFCVGDSIIFSIDAPVPDFTYVWSAVGGGIVQGQGGPLATLVFTDPAGGSVSVFGQDNDAPSCASDPVTAALTSIDFTGSPQITGGPACTNSLQTYAIDIPQHASATYHWFVADAGAGSVVSAADGPTCQVQWNAADVSTDLQLEISLCGQTMLLELPVSLQDAEQPVIAQTTDLCTGGSAQLSLTAAFPTVVWSNGGSGPTTTVTAPGNYQANTIDANGCAGFATFQVSTATGPQADATLSGSNNICVGTTPYPADPVLAAITDTGVDFLWFCNGAPQGTPGPGNANFTHVWTPTVATFTYFVRVFDANGCSTDSDPIKIYQRGCGGGPGCDASGVAKIHTVAASPESPFCDTVNVVATFSADSVDRHDFYGDGGDFTILSAGGSVAGGSTSVRIRINEVGCVRIYSTVYDSTFTTMADGSIDTVVCGLTKFTEACNPVISEFIWEEICGTVSFTDVSLTAPGLLAGPLTYTWDFGDGTPAGSGPNPDHEYTMNDTYTVVLTLSDGVCQNRYEETITVDQIPDADFTFAPGVACAGEVITFTPVGTDLVYWEWDFGDGTGLVSEIGRKTYDPLTPTTFNVELLAISENGCRDSLTQPVTVNPSPLEDEIVSSNGLILCAGETTVLSVTAIPGMSYLWSTGETTASILVADADTYAVTLTNVFGCVTEVEGVTIQVVPLPEPGWYGNPFICGSPGSTTLTATAGGGEQVLWEDLTTGATTVNNTFTIFANGNASHTVRLTVTNPDFGCSASDTIVVVESGVPDATLALSGSGCEGDVNTISIVSPNPEVSYAWSTGATGPSTTTTLAGPVTVVATNQKTGCTATGLVIINPLPDICSVPSGCYEVCEPYTIYAPEGPYFYQWLQDGVPVSTDDSLVVDIDGMYQVYVQDTTTGCGILSGELFLEVIDCDPVVESNCAYVESDSLICTDDKLVVFSLTICVPANADFPVGFLQFIPQSPAAFALLPDDLTLAPALAPGECRTLTFTATDLEEGADFCYLMVAHSADPEEDPAALCCTAEEIRCLIVPDCDPCDNLSAELVDTEDDCCYDIFLNDDAPDFEFDDVVLCLIDNTAGATISATNSAGANLQASTSTDGQSIKVFSQDGGVLPDGSFQLPTICLEAGNQAENLIEVKWRVDGKVVCTDTLLLFCEPDCGYLTPTDVFCEGDTYVWQGIITNTSAFPMSEAYVNFAAPLDAYDVLITFPTLAPGASTSVTFPIGAPAGPNDTICVDVIFHETSDEDYHLNCCKFEACLIMPDCPITKCECAPLNPDLNQGFTVVQSGSTLEYTFATAFEFGPCDRVLWQVRNRSTGGATIDAGSGSPLAYTFQSEGTYDIILTVTRFDDNGKVCEQGVRRRRIQIAGIATEGEAGLIHAFPNPARGELYVANLELASEGRPGELQLFTITGKMTRRYFIPERQEATDIVTLDLNGVIPGVYLLRGLQDGKAWVRRVVVQ